MEYLPRRTMAEQVGCPNSQEGFCSWTGRVQNLVRHYAEQHEELVLRNDTVPLCKQKTEIFYLLAQTGRHFLLSVQYVWNLKLKTMKLTCCLQLVGSEEDASTFRYSLRFELRSGNFKEYTSENVDDAHQQAHFLCIQVQRRTKNQVYLANEEVVRLRIAVTKRAFADLLALNGRILGLLECPCCFVVMVEPIHGCRNGHMLCHVCEKLLRKCPICRVEGELVPNAFAGAVSAEVIRQCKYVERGCAVALAYLPLTAHEESCDYRDVLPAM